jgi:hypothetical protein
VRELRLHPPLVEIQLQAGDVPLVACARVGKAPAVGQQVSLAIPPGAVLVFGPGGSLSPPAAR